MTTTYVVSVGVADVRRDPDPASELVTQALMNRSADVDEFVDGWAHVALSDYTGWIRTSELEDSIALGGGQSTHPYHDTSSQAQQVIVGVGMGAYVVAERSGAGMGAYVVAERSGAGMGAYVVAERSGADIASGEGDIASGVGDIASGVGAPCGYPGPSAKIAVTHTPLYVSAQSEENLGKVYLSTILPLLDMSQQERLQVALPRGLTAWLERSAVSVHQPNELYPRTPVSTITAYARTFLGVPYLWGGTSWEGIDCSGFVQLCYRMGGYIIPRDADQQHDFLDHCVARGGRERMSSGTGEGSVCRSGADIASGVGEWSRHSVAEWGMMQEGDLIFFGRKSITHVAMALNNHEYIHAEGQDYNYVTINSFDLAARNYNANLDKLVYALKRVIV